MLFVANLFRISGHIVMFSCRIFPNTETPYNVIHAKFTPNTGSKCNAVRTVCIPNTRIPYYVISVVYSDPYSPKYRDTCCVIRSVYLYHTPNTETPCNVIRAILRTLFQILRRNIIRLYIRTKFLIPVNLVMLFMPYLRAIIQIPGTL